MKVSAVITNYNYDRWVSEAALSCYESQEKIIVSDNPETAITPDLLNKFCTSFGGRKILVNSKNMGVSYSRNRGIKESTGDIILILDADDYLTEDSISKRLKIFKEKPEVDIVHGPVLRFDEDKGPKTAVLHPSLLTFQGVMIRRRVFEKYGLYHEKLRSAEDKEMLYRWGLHRHSPLKKCVNAVKVDFPVAYYRRHGDSKRKRRKVDRDFDIQTMMEFNSRIKDLELNGITRENTEFLKG